MSENPVFLTADRLLDWLIRFEARFLLLAHASHSCLIPFTSTLRHSLQSRLALTRLAFSSYLRGTVPGTSGL
jgi:hypothetical protein